MTAKMDSDEYKALVLELKEIVTTWHARHDAKIRPALTPEAKARGFQILPLLEDIERNSGALKLRRPIPRPNDIVMAHNPGTFWLEDAAARRQIVTDEPFRVRLT